MPQPDRSHALDHVVVIMFENRSFDNLLGRLYQPGEVASFEGVTGLGLSNPVPEWAAGADPGTAQRLVPYGTAMDMNSPSPDPGEEYQHVNTQLFGLIDPPSNRGMVAQHIVAPYNAPANQGQRPTMDGFVTDYISAFTAEMLRLPVFEEYAQIMTGYTPLQVPVTSALARGFATFDHWFCEVPSQTFPNRSFFHAGTSSGYVVNMEPAESFPLHNDAETIFERLEKQGLTWRVYCDPPSHISLTGIIHAPRLAERWSTNFFTTDRFLADAATGQLPTYSFIEPNLLYGHNDMHPAFDALLPGVDLDPPSALLGGEALLEVPRDPDNWPDVTPRPVPPFNPAHVSLEARLKGLGKAACFPVLALAKDMGLPAPDIDQDEAIARAEAIALIDEVFGHMFRGLHAD
jgi:phospholipase C